MVHFVGPVKHSAEVMRAVFDFTDQVPAGTVISGAACVCTVHTFSGTNDPPNILYGSPLVRKGTIVEQGLQLGVVGNIYQLTMKVTVGSNVYERDCYVPIIPEEGGQISPPAPPPPSNPLNIHGTPPSGTVGIPYSFTWTADGGTGIGYVFSVFTGTVPTGTTLTGTTTWTHDTLLGTPTVAGTYNFNLQVQDSAANTATAPESIVIHEPVYLVVGNGGNISTSNDAFSWSAQTSGTAIALRGITRGNGMFVACGGNGSNNVLLSSPDAVTWTSRTPNCTDVYLTDAAFGNNIFVVTGDPTGTLDGSIITSPDGITWTKRTTPSGSGPLTAVVFAANQFTIVTKTGFALLSPDGINWTKYACGTAQRAVCYSDSDTQYMAVGDSGQTYTSPAGTSWAFRSAPGGVSYSFLSVANAFGHYVASANGTSPYCGLYTSTDSGITWTLKQLTASGGGGLSVANGLLIYGDTGQVWVSSDAVTWTAYAVPGAYQAYAVFAGTL